MALIDEAKTTKGKITIVITILFLFWVFMGATSKPKFDDSPYVYTSQKDPPQTTPLAKEKVDAHQAQTMAAVLCEDRMKNSLRSPSTADFPFFSQANFDGNNRATLTSYVDAQNGFGATVRTRFTCTVEYIGGKPLAHESWKIVNFEAW